MTYMHVKEAGDYFRIPNPLDLQEKKFLIFFIHFPFPGGRSPMSLRSWKGKAASWFQSSA